MGAILQCDQDRPVSQVMDACVQALKAQKAVVVPTDSVYGIAAAATPANPGYQDIFTLKQRPATQTLPWLIADAGELEIYGQQVDPGVFRVVERFWPGPLTVVVTASSQVPEEYLGPDHTIALRIPDSELVRQVERQLGYPLACTSANIHGHPSPPSFDQVDASLVDGTAVSVDGGVTKSREASTILGFPDGVLKFYRVGAISQQEVRDCLEMDFEACQTRTIDLMQA